MISFKFFFSMEKERTDRWVIIELEISKIGERCF